MTRAKTAVLEALQASPTPITLEEVHTSVQSDLPETAFSTVYRIVQQFEAGGLVNRIDWRERGARYEWTTDRPHHHRLVCQSCQKVVDVTDQDVRYDDQHLAQKTGFTITSHAVELTGICTACQERPC